MRSKDLIEQARQKFAGEFLQAVQEGNENALADSVAEFSTQIQEALMEEAADSRQDTAALVARGARVLTREETKYYQALAGAMSAPDVKLAITNMDIAMPETIIDAVMEDISSQFPLLDAIDFRNTTAVTKWFYNSQGTQQAVWGALGTEITKELSGAIKEMDLTMCKLTAYMCASKDFLKLGPAWLDRYIRAVLAEANGLALEEAIADGDGAAKPIGMTRDLSKGTTSDGVTTYARKTAKKVTVLDPATYGAILAELTVSPSGRKRAVNGVIMVVNPKDYLTKVMPATTILTPQGTYVSDILPFPTKVIQSVGIPEGKAAVGLAKRYFAGMGTSRNGFIEYSDHVQFLEDNRIYTTHLYGNGRPLDNNAFVLLDISGLETPTFTVKTIGNTEATTVPEEQGTTK
ncbi:MAG: phage major capsid protein [Lachnospiraceae bacterium]|jgi:HK97 family phage major capsid protein|nr:phage major capsid protein [Lachnospiraceae bacterium]